MQEGCNDQMWKSMHQSCLFLVQLPSRVNCIDITLIYPDCNFADMQYICGESHLDKTIIDILVLSAVSVICVFSIFLCI